MKNHPARRTLICPPMTPCASLREDHETGSRARMLLSAMAFDGTPERTGGPFCKAIRRVSDAGLEQG
jgi:hypothetical protein